jgi:hypothetical protein
MHLRTMFLASIALLILVLPASAQPKGGAAIFDTLPDLTARVDPDGAIVIWNIGSSNVPSGFMVTITCAVVKPTVRGQTCGDAFPGGMYTRLMTLPAGFNQPIYKRPPGQQTFTTAFTEYGKGWAVIYPGLHAWPKGTYKFDVFADAGMAIQEKLETNNKDAKEVVKD